MNKEPTPQTYAALQHAYQLFNNRLFDGKLDDCLITLQRKANTAGYMSYNRFIALDDGKTYTHELALNPEHFGDRPLVEVFQTMVHEMVHLWQLQYGRPSQKTYHNKEWAEKMESIGLMPSDTGMVGGKKTGQRMGDYPIAGGAFIKVCEELFTQDIVVKWYDRYKPKNSSIFSMQAYQSHTKNQLSNMDNELLGKLTLVPHLELQTLQNIIHGTIISPDNGLQLAVDGEFLNPLDYSIEPKPVNKSKVKFTCPMCQDNLWGKPSLQVICGKCKVPFFCHDN